MAQPGSSVTNHQLITNIIKSNNAIKHSTSTTVADFLNLQKEFSECIASSYTKLSIIKDVADIFLPEDKMVILNEFKIFEQVQLLVCGYNSSGKTSFLHQFLAKGNFLPAGTGTVTARIVKFSYAPAKEACLLIHEGGVDSPVVGDPVDLSKYFSSTNQMTVKEKQQRSRELKTTIEQHLGRPEHYDVFSNEFVEWASHLVEICIPSPVLQLGLVVYDTPGFHFGDSPILVQNLQDLIKARRPSILFLYDNATVSEDSRKCSDALKLALHNLADVGFFFLNTKADVTTILRDAGMDELPEQDELNELLEQERIRRYNHLRDVPEMGRSLPDKLNECDCFDIFSVERPEHPMEQIMKKNAIDRIVIFAAKYDLQNTQQVSRIILNTIITFFDFILITNRRSTEEWERLRDEALRWADVFFQGYASHLDAVADEIQRQLPVEFRKHRDNLAKRAKEFEKSWVGNILEVHSDFYAKLSFSLQFDGLRSSIRHQTSIQNFIGSAVQNEVLKPTLNKIVKNMNSQIKIGTNQQEFLATKPSKNELTMAAYRDFLSAVDNIDANIFVHPFSIAEKMLLGLSIPWLIMLSPLIIESIIWRRRILDSESEKLRTAAEIEHYLIDTEFNLKTCGKEIKENLRQWLSDSSNQFKQRVQKYYSIVTKTIEHRKQAYILARKFAARFARIECRLVSNLDLAKHHGMKPDINTQEELNRGGFFSIHPASWNGDQSLVAKVILDPIAHADVAYLEAHFHRTIAECNIKHTVPLRYLYEEDENKLFILLPRYFSSLHVYLCDHMADISMDKAVQIVLDITCVVAHMHAYELVHRDIKAQNILLDDNLQVFLADFGTCQHGTENSTVIGSRPFAPELTIDSKHEFSYKGSSADVYALGVLMYVVAPKSKYYPVTQPVTAAHIDALVNIPASYVELMRRCLFTESKARPTASEVVKELETIADQVANSKPCLMCLDQARYARCLPCRHKTVCNICLGSLRQRATAEKPPQCVLCRQPFTSTQEDADSNTYIVSRE